jgi:leucyl aminopeptidase (aminopeptidase T)
VRLSRVDSLPRDLAIDVDRIRPTVVRMFRVNMGLKDDESILVVTDTPTAQEWQRADSHELVDALTRCLLARAVSEIASEAFPQCSVGLLPYPSVGMSGTEPGEEVVERMKEANVVLALTTHSMSHTRAPQEARKAGARVASMPGFLVEMLYPGDVMDADYQAIAAESKSVVQILTDAQDAAVRSRGGTDLTFSLAGRNGLGCTGLLTEKGARGNLPAGEGCIAPVEGTANGRLVVERGWFPGTEDMVLDFREGLVVEVSGGGDFGDEVREILGIGQSDQVFQGRRNLAELGVGTNPNAKRTHALVEAEKIKGTVHIAIGDNAGLGGSVRTDIHWDFVVPRPDLILDGHEVMRDGNLLV